MNISDFVAQYAGLSDDELLCLWAERDTLVPEAVLALESEVQKRGLNTQNASRVKKRLDALASRNGPLREQVAVANYERKMRNFHGWEEPEFYSPYSGRDIRRTFSHLSHKYKVWKAFYEHTGHWPVLSIWYFFLSWIGAVVLSLKCIFWILDRAGSRFVNEVAMIIFVLVLFGLRDLGARQIRKLDWKKYGESKV
jgi:hypothetical protein